MNTTVNQRVITLIESKKNYSHNQFAKELGINRGTLQNVVSNKSKPSFPILHDLAVYFQNLNCRWLLTGTGKTFLEKNEEEKVSILREKEMKYENKVALLEKEIENYKARLTDKDNIIKTQEHTIRSKDDLLDTYERVLKGKGFFDDPANNRRGWR